MSRPRTSTRGSLPVPRETLDRALDLVRGGMTIAAAAEALGYSSRLTLSSWRQRYPWFAPALDAARAESKTHRRAATVSQKILARVRSGETQRAAATAEGVHYCTITRWRGQVPGFAEALTAAQRAGRRVRYGSVVARRKADVLTWVGRGKTTTAACRMAGCTDADVHRWRRSDPDFAAEFARAVGPTCRPRAYAKFKRMIVLVRDGETVWNAARKVKLGPHAPFRWRDDCPELWSEIVKAYEDSGREPPRRRGPYAPRERREA